jgi:hypothetical protein
MRRICTLALLLVATSLGLAVGAAPASADPIYLPPVGPITVGPFTLGPGSCC